MDKIKVVFKGISRILGSDSVGLLMLTDIFEHRLLTIVVDKDSEKSIFMRLKKLSVVERSLPEVLVKLNPMLNSIHFEYIINSIQAGHYNGYLLNKDDLSLTSLRVSDGVLLSIITGIDIYVTSELMNRQSVPYTPLSGGMALPVNALSLDMLEHSLERAIENEDYEMASNLRDEINRRHDSNIGMAPKATE